MKLLYVGQPIKTNPKTGGEYINYRNYKLLEEIFGKDNVFIIEISTGNKIKFYYNLIFNKYLLGLNSNEESKILNDLINIQYDYVFISSSQLGKLTLKIKRKFPHIKIMTFFHNIEYQYYKEYVKVSGIHKLPLVWGAKFNEMIAVKFSDKIITINERDSRLLSKFYGRKSDLELPTSFVDVFKIENIITESDYKNIKYLFVGTNFFANYEGIKWFATTVMKNIPGTLHIVGKGTEAWKEDLVQDNIIIHGAVEDLSKHYYDADIVVIPILSGGGMKTKTAEALMYGKAVFGTKEAFEGYTIEYGKVGEICNTSEEFINQIEYWIKNRKLEKYNEFSRQCFLSKYSFEGSLSKIKQLFQQTI